MSQVDLQKNSNTIKTDRIAWYQAVDFYLVEWDDKIFFLLLLKVKKKRV